MSKTQSKETFIGSLLFLFLFSVSLFAKDTKKIHRSYADEQIENFKQAFYFLNAEADFANIDVWFEQLLVEKPDSPELLELISVHSIKKKDRSILIDLYSRVVKAYQCDSSSKLKVCSYSQRMWVDNLDSIPFYEESSGKIEKLRRLAASESCTTGKTLFDEIYSKEGPSKPVLELGFKIYTCLGNTTEAKKIKLLQDSLTLF
jgi:hypothetical protein